MEVNYANSRLQCGYLCAVTTSAAQVCTNDSSLMESESPESVGLPPVDPEDKVQYFYV